MTVEAGSQIAERKKSLRLSRWLRGPSLRREVAGDVQNQVGQVGSISVNRTIVGGNDRHIRRDDSVVSIQRRYGRLAFAIGPECQIWHWAQWQCGRVEHIGLRIGRRSAHAVHYVDGLFAHEREAVTRASVQHTAR